MLFLLRLVSQSPLFPHRTNSGKIKLNYAHALLSCSTRRWTRRLIFFFLSLCIQMLKVCSLALDATGTDNKQPIH